MPLFKCEKCGCIENTACCNYWSKDRSKDALLCSECDPEIKEWHGRFDKRPAKGMLIDQNGHLWSQQDVDSGKLPQHYKIVGKVE